MTDEEMAEEEYKNCKFEKVEHYCDKAIYVTGYLAGLHEGQEENNKLLDVINNQDVKIADLEKKGEQAKEIIAIVQRVCETSSAEYMSLYTKKAELFLREI